MRASGNTKIILRVTKAIIWLAPIVVFGWILNKQFVPLGTMIVRYDPMHRSPLVRNFASKEPDILIGTENKPGSDTYFQLITASPMYFDVRVPRPFKRATVQLTYLNPDNQPKIQLAIQQANLAYIYQDMAIQSAVLDSLPNYWDEMTSGEIHLWQRNLKYYEDQKKHEEAYRSRKSALDNWRKEELDAIGKSSTGDAEASAKRQSVEDGYSEELQKIESDRYAIERAEPAYATVDDFLENPPAPRRVVQSDYPMDRHYTMPDYKPSTNTRKIIKSIRGSHEILTYIGEQEDLNFTFAIQDINRHAGGDTVVVRAYNTSGQMVASKRLADDGDQLADGKVLPERLLSILAEGMPTGVYRISIETNDDVFIKSIETFQQLIMLKGHVYITDNPEYRSVLGVGPFTPTLLYTDSSRLGFRTAHDAGRQTVTVGGDQIAVDELHVMAERDGLGTEIKTVHSPKNDLYIEGDGYFAFERDHMFDPNFASASSVDEVSSPDDYDFIIARYRLPMQANGWYVASATVAAPALYFKQESFLTARFIINLPGLHENNRSLKVKEVLITFEKDPLTLGKLFGKLKSMLRR